MHHQVTTYLPSLEQQCQYQVAAIPECNAAIDGRQTSWRLKLSVKTLLV